MRKVLRRSPIHAIIHCNPIDRNLSQQVLSPRYGDTRIVVGEGAGICYRHNADAGFETRQLKKVTTIKRKVLNLNLAHTTLYGKLAGVNARCLTTYEDSFLDRSRMQLKVDCQLVPNKQPDILHLRSEARSKSLDLVITRIEIGYVVLAGSIRPHDPPVPKLLLPDSESRVGHEGAGNIPDLASNSSLWSLCQKGVLDQNE